MNDPVEDPVEVAGLRASEIEKRNIYIYLTREKRVENVFGSGKNEERRERV